jgi:hypothetical protein
VQGGDAQKTAQSAGRRKWPLYRLVFQRGSKTAVLCTSDSPPILSANRMAPRIIVRIEVTKQARDEIDRLSRKLGMTYLSMHSRMVQWLSNQPDEIRAGILHNFPAEVKGDIARLILKSMQGAREAD